MHAFLLSAVVWTCFAQPVQTVTLSKPVKTVDEFRKLLEREAMNKKCKLVSGRFDKQHLFSGHAGNPKDQNAKILGQLRKVPTSTLLSKGQVESQVKDEVKNFIKRTKFQGNGKVWIIPTGTVKSVHKYKTWTVSENNKNDVKQSRKFVKVAFSFRSANAPCLQLYHMDFKLKWNDEL